MDNSREPTLEELVAQLGKHSEANRQYEEMKDLIQSLRNQRFVLAWTLVIAIVAAGTIAGIEFLFSIVMM